MPDQNETPARAAAELDALRRRVAELEAAETERKRFERELERRAAQLETLRQMSLELTSQLDVDALLRSVVSRAVELLQGDAGDLHLYRPEQDALQRHIVVERCLTPGETLLRRGEGLAGQVWDTGRTILVQDYQKWAGRAPAFEAYPVAAVVGAPVRWGGEFLGVLDVWANAPRVFVQADADLLEMFAAQAAIALKNARLYQAEREQFGRLQESLAQLIRAEKMAALGRLAAAVAHEINNPLQVVQGNLELALEEAGGWPHGEALHQYLGIAIDEVERITDIVRAVQRLYEPARWAARPVDVKAVLESALELVAGQLQQGRVNVEREWAAGLPAVQVNPEHLRQVFVELALNALDAMAGDGGTLRIRAAADRPLAANGRARAAVCIEFSDTGAGLSPEALSRVFDPVVAARKGRTGLGLFISYGIVELYNGQLTVSSQEGAGSTFCVLLPVEENHGQDTGY